MPEWIDKPAPPIAVNYWHLSPDAKMVDVLLAVRADERSHQHVNQVFASLPDGAINPFGPLSEGKHHIAPVDEDTDTKKSP